MSTDAVRAALAELVAATNPDGETSVADWRKAWAAARAALSEPVPSVGVPEWIPVHTRLPAWADDNSVRVIVYTEGYDFGGVQVHDIAAAAADFYDTFRMSEGEEEEEEEEEEEGTEVTRRASHWMYREDLVRLAAAPSPPTPQEPTP